MNKFKQFFLLCLLLGSFVSCGEKDDDPKPTVATEQDYQPTTAGSTWNYGGQAPYTTTALGTKKEINGKAYHEMQVTQGSAKRVSYLLKESGVYTAIGLDPNIGNIELIFLKEKAAVGESWSQTSVLNGVDTKMVLTVMGKDISKTVEGKTYTQVIHVQLLSTYSYMGIKAGSSTANYFWAKGIGLISINALGQQIPLLSYSIK